jgi:hypothetical protein
MPSYVFEYFFLIKGSNFAMECKYRKNVPIEFTFINFDKFIDLINSRTEAKNMSLELAFHFAVIVKNFLIYCLAYFSNHLVFISILKMVVIFITDRNWICPTTNLQGFSLKIFFEKMNIHRSRSDNDFKVLSLCQ